MIKNSISEFISILFFDFFFLFSFWNESHIISGGECIAIQSEIDRHKDECAQTKLKRKNDRFVCY